MTRTVRNAYFSILFALAALSGYPLVMGSRIILLHLQAGSIRPEDYARYVIPYTAVCASILLVVVLYPLLSRLAAYTKTVAAILGMGIFVGLELYMESITVNTPEAQRAVQFQLFSCIGTPAAVSAFQGSYSDAYKIHYFLISFLLIIMVTGVCFGLLKWVSHQKRAYGIPLAVQTATMVLFLVLCVFANFTGFFRTGSDSLSPLSAWLTGGYFVVLGSSIALYLGCELLRSRHSTLSVLLPVLLSLAVCILMYYGESKLLGGHLYQLGWGSFYTPLPMPLPLAPVDIAVIAASGLLTFVGMVILRKSVQSSNVHAL